VKCTLLRFWLHVNEMRNVLPVALGAAAVLVVAVDAQRRNNFSGELF